MNKEVKNQLDFIRLLTSANTSQRRRLIDISTRDQLKSVVDIVYNILLGHCPISNTTKAKVSKFKVTMRLIAKKSVCEKKEESSY